MSAFGWKPRAAEAGDGASAPVGYVTGESVESVLDALNTAGPALVGMPTERLGPLLARACALLADAPAARAGLEMALYDMWARERHLPLWQHFGGMQDRVTTDVTIPLVSPEAAADLARASLGGRLPGTQNQGRRPRRPPTPIWPGLKP